MRLMFSAPGINRPTWGPTKQWSSSRLSSTTRHQPPSLRRRPCFLRLCMLPPTLGASARTPPSACACCIAACACYLALMRAAAGTGEHQAMRLHRLRPDAVDAGRPGAQGAAPDRRIYECLSHHRLHSSADPGEGLGVDLRLSGAAPYSPQPPADPTIPACAVRSAPPDPQLTQVHSPPRPQEIPLTVTNSALCSALLGDVLGQSAANQARTAASLAPLVSGPRPCVTTAARHPAVARGSPRLALAARRSLLAARSRRARCAPRCEHACVAGLGRTRCGFGQNPLWVWAEPAVGLVRTRRGFGQNPLCAEPEAGGLFRVRRAARSLAAHRGAPLFPPPLEPARRIGCWV